MERPPSIETSSGDSGPDPDGDWAQSRRASWAALIKLVYEADPLLCRCFFRMRIVSVIREPSVVERILKHVHYCFDVLQLPARPPPPAGPPEPDWDDSPCPDAYYM